MTTERIEINNQQAMTKPQRAPVDLTKCRRC